MDQSRISKAGVKCSIYVPADIYADMKAEAVRQQRTVSWLISRCWRGYAKEIKKQSAVPTLGAIKHG